MNELQRLIELRDALAKVSDGLNGTVAAMEKAKADSHKLSNRVRPDSEAAPWVVAEIKAMERRIDKMDSANKWQSDWIKKLTEFARDVRDNYDCDQDAHKHGTTCRVCAAKKVLEYPDPT